MLKSIQWKIVLIYSLLILFAMQFFAVLLTQSLERYYLDNYAENLESHGLLLANFLERYLGDAEDVEAIDTLVLEYSRYGRIVVLDSFGRVISSSAMQDDLRGQRIIQDEITHALTGSRSEAVRQDPLTRERIKYMALPIRSGERTLGVVYLSGSLEPVYAMLREIQIIFVTGAVLVIGVTVALGFILAKTITGPIQEVTERAAQIAHGDYRQRIAVRSRDEIGRLGEMFNYLSSRLDETLSEISSEKGKVEAILNHMTDGIVALNKNGEILHVNPAARHILKIEDRFRHADPALRDLLKDFDIADFLASGRQITREIYLNARKKSLLVSYVPFLTQIVSDKSYSGVLIVLHDMTNEREMMRIQQEFVANVSHELRTPLTTLKSYTETLLAGAMHQKDVCLSFLATMEKETDRMVRLVRDLLALSQLDFHQVLWHKEMWALEDIVSEVVKELSVKFGESRQVRLMPPQRSVPCYVDRDKIKQVLINVIQNAFKFTSQDGEIDITVLQTDSEAQVCVKDNGIGIPADEVPKVFERFYRVDKARTRAWGGTGLGLSIAKDIVKAHNGDIEIHSGIGEGTQVLIRLPNSPAEGGRTECVSA